MNWILWIRELPFASEQILGSRSVEDFIFGIPIGLAFVWLGVLLLGWLAGMLWSWIDESPWDGKNLFGHFYMEFRGYESDGTGSRQWEKTGHTYSDGSFELLTIPAIIFCFLPSLLYISVMSPILPLVSGVCIALAFLARFSRRMHKVLKKHIADKSIHVQGD